MIVWPYVQDLLDGRTVIIPAKAGSAGSEMCYPSTDTTYTTDLQAVA